MVLNFLKSERHILVWKAFHAFQTSVVQDDEESDNSDHENSTSEVVVRRKSSSAGRLSTNTARAFPNVAVQGDN